MSSYRVEQRRVSVRGRGFHFVSYEGTPANPAKQIAATAPMWFLMSAGKRWLVMPHQIGQDPLELDRLFTEWLDRNVFA
jgi:hypothetical protein